MYHLANLGSGSYSYDGRAGMLVAALLFGFAIFAPIGFVMPSREEINSLEEGLFLIVPIVILNPFAVHILGKYKVDFRRNWI